MARPSCSLTRRLLLLVFLPALAGMCLLLPASKVCAQTPTATPLPTILPIKPVQRDAILSLKFSRKVKPVAVKVGNVDAPILSQSSSETDSLDVKVLKETALGQQPIAVTLATDPANPAVPATPAATLTSSVIVAPLILGFKPDPDKKETKPSLSKFAVAGGGVILQFADEIPSEIRQKLIVKLNDLEVPYTIQDNNSLELDVPDDLPQTTYTVNVSIDGVILQQAPKLGVVYTSRLYLQASGNLLALIIAVYLLYKVRSKIARKEERYWFGKALLLEPENQTYSLSRAQFLAWMVVIVWCYLFLYFAHGYVDRNWEFPKLGGAVYAFLISLGTLVVSQATTKSAGPKGAGEVHPSLSDLVTHGGVLALDRIQQVIWTLIALGMFIRIVITTFGTAQGLPPIPQELLVLMGLSSAGYLGGKLVRGPGPVINEVIASAGSVVLAIRGKHFSKDCFVWIDGVKQESTILTFIDDPDDPKYAKEIGLTLANATLEAWNGQQHAVTVVNDDAQRADWRSGDAVASTAPTAPGLGGVAAGGNAAVAGAAVEGNAAAEAQAAAEEKAAAEAKAASDATAAEGTDRG